MADGFDRSAVVVGEVAVRLVRADERRRWDALMDAHHYLGFRQFAGRGVRHVAEWRGHWLALLGWQSGAFKCAPRDRWLGWHRSVQFRRLHLIGNNTRFLVLPEASGIACLASRALGRSLRRLSADWQSLHGHPLELAETFVDPARFRGTCYAASNWVRVGRTKGFARHNGSYTDPHESPKEMFVRPLRRDAPRRLADPADRPSGRAGRCRCATRARSCGRCGTCSRRFRTPGAARAASTGWRRCCRCARWRGLPASAARRPRSALRGTSSKMSCGRWGAWRNAGGRWVAPSDSTICRVLADTDPDALQDVLRPVGRATPGAHGTARRRWRRTASASAAPTAMPAAAPASRRSRWSLTPAVRSRAGAAATRAARSPPCARCSRDVRRPRLRAHPRCPARQPQHRAGHRRGTRRGLRARGQGQLPGHPRATRRDGLGGRRRTTPRRRSDQGPRPHRGAVHHCARPAAGTPSPRSPPPAKRSASCASAKTRRRAPPPPRPPTASPPCPAERAGPAQLLAWNRGHWQVENANHYRRDATMGEGRQPRPRPARARQPRHPQQHRPRHRVPPWLPLRPRGQPALHDAPRRGARRHPVRPLIQNPPNRRPHARRAAHSNPRIPPTENPSRTRKTPEPTRPQCRHSAVVGSV